MDFDPNQIIKEIDDRYGRLKVSEMESYLAETVANASRQYGEDSPGFAALLNELGGFYRAVSKYDLAEGAFLKAKEILRNTLGERDPNYATTINNLAGLYRLTGDFAQAERLFLQAIEIYGSTPSKGSFAHSSALNNLGLLYQETKQYPKAARLHEEAIEMGPGDKFGPVVHATSLSNLATAYLGMRRIFEAEKLLKEAIEIYRKSLGEKDPHYASAINNLGLLYFAINDYQKAEECFLHALKLREQVFGRNHHEFAKVSDNLRVLYTETGKLAEAETHARQAAESYLGIFGKSHPAYQKSIAELEKLQALRRKQAANSVMQPVPTTERYLEAAPASDRSALTAAASGAEMPAAVGMTLSLQYYRQFGAPMIANLFPEYDDRIAVGLVGEGSECFGFDDELSRDHDWGPSFCLWLSNDDYAKIGSRLELEYSRLPQNYLGYEMKNSSEFTEGRRGVFEIGSFYKKYIGLDHPPSSIREWKAIPEVNLSIVTNGMIFKDTLKEFTAFREALKAFYPEDVRLKKIAARCAIMAQSGQYNYMRSVKRSEFVAAQYALSQFIDSGISMAFLLNREYRPFYKWMHRGLRSLPILGASLYEMFMDLSAEKKTPDEAVFERRNQLIEKICAAMASELQRQGLSRHVGGFLLDHAYAVRDHISDPELKSMHVMVE